MPTEEHTLVLEHLRYIRHTIDRMAADIQALKFRAGNIKTSCLQHTHRFDRVEERLNRIERRLDLYEPPYLDPPPNQMEGGPHTPKQYPLPRQPTQSLATPLAPAVNGLRSASIPSGLLRSH